MAVLTTVAAGLGAAKAIADTLKFSNGSGLANGVALAGSDSYNTSDIQDVDLEKNKEDDVNDIIRHSILAKANGPDEDDSNPRQVKDVPDLEPMQRGAFSSVFETEPKSEPVYSSDESPEEIPTSSSSETNNGDGPGTDTDIKATMKDTGSDSSGSFGNGLVMGSPSSVNSVNEVASPGALAIPPSTQVPQLQVENKEEVENPLLNEAQEAYGDDKDIDADELDYVKDEDAAEQVEDYVEAVDSGELDEDKAEEELEKAAEDGEVEKNELDMNLVKTLAKFVFPDTAEGSEDGIHLGGKESYDAADIKDVSLSNDTPESDSSPDGSASGGPSFSSSVGSVSSGSSKGVDFSSQESSAKSSAGSSKSLNNTPSGSSSSSSGSSSSGSMKSTFDKIMAGGIDSKTSGGDSSFEDSGMSGGNVGSVEVKGNDEPLKIGQTQNGNIPQAKVAENPVTESIHEVVSNDWEKWPERDGIHYKAKGSIGIFTKNGQDVFVKMGKSKIQPLEDVDSNKLGFVEEIL